MLKPISKLIGMRSYKMVLIVRSDLKMNAGKIAAQCSHASVELYKQALNSKVLNLNTWSLLGQPKIVLKVDSESTLFEIYNEAKTKNMNTSLVYDAGKTAVKEGTLTVLGIGPHEEKEVDLLTRNLKLL